MVKIIKELRRRKILMFVLLPIIFALILCVWASIIKMDVNRLNIWIDFTGLLLTTLGAIFAIRPIIRPLINPTISVRNRTFRDSNAGIIAAGWLISGFAFQMINRIFLLNLINTFVELEIIIIAVSIIAFFMFINSLKKLGWRQNDN